MKPAIKRGGFNNKLCIGVIVLLIIFVPLLLSQLPSRKEIIKAEKIAVEPIPSSGGSPRPPTQQYVSKGPEYYKERATKRHHIQRELLDPENEEQYSHAKVRCKQLSQHDQLIDPECTAVWLNRLKYGKITGVKTMWGFEDTHNGAITLELDGTYKAMFKPCTSSSENTNNEVIASHIDQVLGWGQVAPVIGRRISVSELAPLMRTEADKKVLERTKATCAKGDIFDGPVMGWWEGLIPIRTVRKYKAPIEEFRDLRADLSKNKYTTQEQAKFHAFYWLVNILRHGKDEFVARSGDLVALDLDRSKIQSVTPIDSLKTNYSWCYSCYQSQEAYDAFTLTGPNASPEYRLGHLIAESIAFEELIPDLWNEYFSEAMDNRVAELLRCTDNCIASWGKKNVLINEPRTMSDIDLVRYYVKNSAYKNQNGQRAPNQSVLDEIGVVLPKIRR